MICRKKLQVEDAQSNDGADIHAVVPQASTVLCIVGCILHLPAFLLETCLKWTRFHLVDGSRLPGYRRPDLRPQMAASSVLFSASLCEHVVRPESRVWMTTEGPKYQTEECLKPYAFGRRHREVREGDATSSPSLTCMSVLSIHMLSQMYSTA
ncbi:uncharacterized protein EI97DRAFT_81677 [Westerdykella ornata]|uniref:Uncharacterized protein n=1 Tax=Westerdykella ornata TaxID=318751 RepID=A0A6A6JG32_WESOR|nr:uncharacterized protein EI97DRAFT_81677 [Westerdykella ornata]KAF2275225.1 hypothetical protein EI97DRAFT_81677 [Westerdykella ornata]